MADQTARIGELKRALELVEQLTAERTREIAAVLRLALTVLRDGGQAGDVGGGIDAAVSMLIALEGDVYEAITEVHQCGPS